jgi:hypothetical protein
MSRYKSPDLQKRQSDAAAAKDAQLIKYRRAVEDPAVSERAAARVALNDARLARVAERTAVKKLRQIEQAEEDERRENLALQAEREAEALAAVVAAEMCEREATHAAEQKALRDARYAARKTKKQRR